MSAMVTALAVLIAAPALAGPDEGQVAREKLEKLKKKLPGVATEWMKEHWGNDLWRMDLRVLRRLAATEAKASFVIRYVGKPGDPAVPASSNYVVTVYLKYHDGAWTSTRYESSLSPPDKSVMHLMLAIDEIDPE